MRYGGVNLIVTSEHMRKLFLDQFCIRTKKAKIIETYIGCSFVIINMQNILDMFTIKISV